MKFGSPAAGRLIVLLTVLLWGTTFISTKVLLKSFSAFEIVFLRFALGYCMLWCFLPRKWRFFNLRHELICAGAGVSGIALYFLFENLALARTTASNVGIMVSTSPLFTALLAWLILREKRPSGHFFLGFAIAMSGLTLILFDGKLVIEVAPVGDLMAIGAALLWAIYSIIMQLAAREGLPTILLTRRVFFYGILCMTLLLPYFGLSVSRADFLKGANLFNLFYLGFGASALCFALWNRGVKLLGAMEPSLYIYFIPVVTVVSAALLLGERLSPGAVCGAFLTFLGLLVSERRGKVAASIRTLPQKE